NVALVLTGVLGEKLSIASRGVPVGVDPFGMLVTYTLTTVVLSGIGILLIYAFTNKYILTNPIYYDGANKKNKNDHLKLSLSESVTYLLSSKYLGFISILLVSYGIASNFIDVAWRGQACTYFSHRSTYCEFMYRFTFWTGITTIVCSFMTKGIIRRFGWFTGAIITPSVLLVSGLCFFSFILFRESLEGIASLFGTSSLYMAVVIGAVLNIFSKIAKHSLFDPTKEMAYIPLDQELKVKGKAAVDVIGGRCGKGSGGFIQTFLLITTAGNLITTIPYLLGIFIVVILAWMGAVNSLSRLYTARVKFSEKDPILGSQF
ncbi:MAG TPA: Npt1/Npt2 family nucleotide transporter, partial [Candidatus Babeliaceae bacterium]|nr:Npt1/Npt2 family nucleotide transporter [Candidatus Babeliaceae bacterium]